MKKINALFVALVQRVLKEYKETLVSLEMLENLGQMGSRVPKGPLAQGEQMAQLVYQDHRVTRAFQVPEEILEKKVRAASVQEKSCLNHQVHPVT